MLRDDISFRISHDVLQQTGRRAEIRARIVGQLEWLYPFPAGAFTATLAAADLPAEHRALAGEWRLEFGADGSLLAQRAGQPPIRHRYERQPRYRFVVTGDAAAWSCVANAAEYRWYRTAAGSLKLLDYPEDACLARATALRTAEWVPAGR